MEETLQELVLEYQATGSGLEAIGRRVAAELYRDPGRFGFEGEDDAAEALERHRERILGLAGRYVDRGAPFEAYLAVSLRFLARSMRRERRRSKERELVCERAETWDAEARAVEAAEGTERPHAAEGEAAAGTESAPRPAASRSSSAAALKSRLVFLYLKCAWEADDAETSRVAEAAGVPSDWLAAAAGQSRRFLETERRRFERLRARRDRSWSRLRLLEGRLASECEPPARERLSASIARERENFRRAREAIARFKPIVPNSVVAKILGVPKGTVDSGLYYLKRLERGRAGQAVPAESRPKAAACSAR